MVRHVAKEALELCIEGFVACRGCGEGGNLHVGGRLAEIVVAGNGDVVGFLDVAMACRGEFQYTVHFNLLGNQFFEQGLT